MAFLKRASLRSDSVPFIQIECKSLQSEICRGKFIWKFKSFEENVILNSVYLEIQL